MTRESSYGVAALSLLRDISRRLATWFDERFKPSAE
jgi:hypothetical protein